MCVSTCVCACECVRARCPSKEGGRVGRRAQPGVRAPSIPAPALGVLVQLSQPYQGELSEGPLSSGPEPSSFPFLTHQHPALALLLNWQNQAQELEAGVPDGPFVHQGHLNAKNVALEQRAVLDQVRKGPSCCRPGGGSRGPAAIRGPPGDPGVGRDGDPSLTQCWFPSHGRSQTPQVTSHLPSHGHQTVAPVPRSGPATLHGPQTMMFGMTKQWDPRSAPQYLPPGPQHASAALPLPRQRSRPGRA